MQELKQRRLATFGTAAERRDRLKKFYGKSINTIAIATGSNHGVLHATGTASYEESLHSSGQIRTSLKFICEKKGASGFTLCNCRSVKLKDDGIGG